MFLKGIQGHRRKNSPNHFLSDHFQWIDVVPEITWVQGYALKMKVIIRDLSWIYHNLEIPGMWLVFQAKLGLAYIPGWRGGMSSPCTGGSILLLSTCMDSHFREIDRLGTCHPFLGTVMNDFRNPRIGNDFCDRFYLFLVNRLYPGSLYLQKLRDPGSVARFPSKAWARHHPGMTSTLIYKRLRPLYVVPEITGVQGYALKTKVIIRDLSWSVTT